MDTTSYDRYFKEQTAKNAGFIDKDGNADTKAYEKYRKNKRQKKLAL